MAVAWFFVVRRAGDGNRDLNFGGKAIAVRGISGDPALCIIDCEGGGIGFFFVGEGPNSIVEGLTIMNGDAFYAPGGGVCCEWSSPTLINCTFSANMGSYYLGGGGVCCEGANPTLVNCTFARNYSDVLGGGMTIAYGGAPTLVNCLFTRNIGDGAGGVFIMYSSAPMIINCTFSGNCSWHGAAHSYESFTTVTNCIMWGDYPDEVYGFTEVYHSVVQGGWHLGADILDTDPLFVDPEGPDGDPNSWRDNDYRLSAGSPCIDAADNTAVPPDVGDLDGNGDTDERTPFDLDGNLRFVDDAGMPDDGLGTAPIVDMGAHEFQGETCFGDLDGDNDIDLADLATLLAHYEAAGTV